MAAKSLTFTGEDVRITDLVTPQRPIVTDVEFVRCRILGPALLLLADVELVGSDFGSLDAPDSLIWTVPPWQTSQSGAISIDACVFRDCTFEGVAFACHQRAAYQLRRLIETSRGRSLRVG